MRTVLIAPSEPPTIAALGKTSSLPERFGADMMWWVDGRRVGVQRKEVRDLRASAADGRLGKELGQMQAAGVDIRLLVVEGRVTFDADGRLVDGFGAPWTRAQWWGVQWSVQAAGCWVSWTANSGETVDMVRMFEKWTQKDRHTSLMTRGRPGSIWGTRPDAREYATWVLQGIDGVGVELAGRIYDVHGGLPVTWAPGVDAAWLEQVPGIGKVKAAKISRGLGGG